MLQAGFDVQVYEQTRDHAEVGAGLVIGPNASRLLHRLGLAEKLDAIGVKPEAFHQRRWQDGRTLAYTRLREATEAAYGAPHYVFHRGEMHAVLAQALPPDRVHLGHRCTGFVDRGDRIEARFDNGVEITADALIGADGIHSVIRHALLGPERPRFTGCIAYRGLIPAERVAHLGLDRATNNSMGPGRHFVYYFVSAGRMLNFVGLLEQDAWIKESWTEPGDVADLAAAYAGFHPQVRGIIAAADETFKWALLDRDAVAALVVRAHHPAGRRLPSDAAVSGSGRRPSDRGRCSARGLHATLWRRRAGRASNSINRCDCREPRGARRSPGRT